MNRCFAIVLFNTFKNGTCTFTTEEILQTESPLKSNDRPQYRCVCTCIYTRYILYIVVLTAVHYKLISATYN